MAVSKATVQRRPRAVYEHFFSMLTRPAGDPIHDRANWVSINTGTTDLLGRPVVRPRPRTAMPLSICSVTRL